MIIKQSPRLNKGANETGRTERMPPLCAMESRFLVRQSSEWGSVWHRSTNFRISIQPCILHCRYKRGELFKMRHPHQNKWRMHFLWRTDSRRIVFVLPQPIWRAAKCGLPHLCDTSTSVYSLTLALPRSLPHSSVNAALAPSCCTMRMRYQCNILDDF